MIIEPRNKQRRLSIGEDRVFTLEDYYNRIISDYSQLNVKQKLDVINLLNDLYDDNLKENIKEKA